MEEKMLRLFFYGALSLVFGIQLVLAAEDPKEYMVFTDLNFKKNFERDQENIAHELIGHRKKLIGLDLSDNAMTSDNFRLLTDKLLKVEKKKRKAKNASQHKEVGASKEKSPFSPFLRLKILDLSKNDIDEHAAPSLLQWLALHKDLKINLTGTGVGVRNIAKLYDKLADLPDHSPERALGLMSRVVFVSSDYLSEASRNVQIYKTLQDEGKLPQDWAQIHRSFYKSVEYKNLLQQRNLYTYQWFLKKIEALSLADKASDEEKSQEDSDQDIGEDGKNGTSDT
jgi:hypothetical protein